MRSDRLPDGGFLLSAHNHAGKVIIRRGEHFPAVREFLLREADEIVQRRFLDRRFRRAGRLHQDPAAAMTTSGASRDLRDQLKGPLGRPQVGLMQDCVRRNHADQGDVRKIQTLGDHLRA